MFPTERSNASISKTPSTDSPKEDTAPSPAGTDCGGGDAVGSNPVAFPRPPPYAASSSGSHRTNADSAASSLSSSRQGRKGFSNFLISDPN